MGLSTLFITAMIIGFSGAMMPGPLLTATINESYYKGASAGPRLIFGHAILEALLVVGLIGGLDAFLVLPAVKVAIAVLGGLFLLWMGWGIVRDAWLQKVELNLEVTGSTKKLPLEAIGILTSIANPYWTLWWVTIGLSYISMALANGYLGLLAFFLGHISADFIWYTAVSFGITSGKRIISDALYRAILLICGLFLMVLALYFIYSGLTFLRT
ncbi:MAG: LysE family transporter [Thermoanaerobacteraceae bacterium]|nr:LysE family transporter [Thermoanaerobacteraceae bacterium]